MKTVGLDDNEQMTRIWLAGICTLLMSAALVRAHEITVKGTVAAVEAARIQVKTGEEKKDAAPTWYAVDAKTKTLRGKTAVPFAQAKIKAGERVVLVVDHGANGVLKTLEIHLSAD